MSQPDQKTIYARYNALLNQTHDMITIMDLRGHYLAASKTVRDMFGLDDATMNEGSYRDVLSEEDKPKADAILQRLLAGEEVPTYERIFQRTDGATFVAEVNVTLIRDEAGNPMEILSIARNVTRRKQVEAKWLENERLSIEFQKEQELNAMRADLLVKINHEFRTPLAVINTYVGLMQRHFDRLTVEKRESYLIYIQDNVRRLSEMLDDLYVIYQTQSGKSKDREWVDMTTLVNNVVMQISSTDGKNHTIITDIRTQLPPFWGYERLLWHTLYNIVNNAIHYSAEQTTVHIALWNKADDLYIQVGDNGVGIPEADLPRLTEPFYRGHNADKASGTGLGLSVVNEAIKAHSGVLSIESTVDVGTTVIIRLPIRTMS